MPHSPHPTWLRFVPQPTLLAGAEIWGSDHVPSKEEKEESPCSEALGEAAKRGERHTTVRASTQGLSCGMCVALRTPVRRSEATWFWGCPCGPVSSHALQCLCPSWSPCSPRVRVSECVSLLTHPCICMCVSAHVTPHVFSFHMGSGCQTPHNFTQAVADCRHVIEMDRGVGHDLSLLDGGGAFPGVEGPEPESEEVGGGRMRGSLDVPAWV